MMDAVKHIKQGIFRIFSKHTMLKLAGVILLVYLFTAFAGWLPTLKIKSQTILDGKDNGLSPQTLALPADGSVVKVFETDTKELYIDTKTLNVIVEDKATGTTFSSIRPDGTDEERSLIRISYLGEDNTVLNWDSYRYAVKDKTFTLEQIDGGVRIWLEMKELDSYRLNEYMPMKISIERYEEVFLDGLAKKAEENVITNDDVEKYKTTLSLVYAKDEVLGCYYNRYASAPPLSAVSQLITITKLLNYTTEQLILDNAEFGISVTIEEPACFIIPIELTLDKEDFIVRIATEYVENKNPYYVLTNIEVLPYFGSVSKEEAADGYILVPDGSGALLELNKFNPNYGTYKRALYDNTWYNDYYYLNTYKEKLQMPVFGMTYGKDEDSKGGFLGIIENGDNTAFITAALSSELESGGGGKYNKVHSSFDTTQFCQVSIMGPYDTSGGRFFASTGMLHIDYVIRYKLYTGKVDYYDMAQTYKEYLIDRYGLSLHYEEHAKLFLDVTGALTLEKRILGIAYDDILSMTDYKELMAILEDLKGIPLALNYMGVFNEGLNHTVMNRADLTKENGSRKELLELMKTADQNGQELFIQADFSIVHKESSGFSEKKHASYDFYGYPVTAYPYNYSTGSMWGMKYYTIVNPIYLSSIVDGFIKDSSEYKNLYISDLAGTFYASYEKNKIVTPLDAGRIVNENLKKLSDSKSLSLHNPDMNNIRYGKYAVNISRESSGHGGIAHEIPFRQLVMNGLITYTTINVNETAVNSRYYLLQALELGSSLKYTVTAKSLDLLKNSVHNEFISREYELLKDDIKDLYGQYMEAFQEIQSTKITGHKILSENIFETIYDNGVRVITNYNKFPVYIEGYEVEVDALSWHIIRQKGGEQIG